MTLTITATENAQTATRKRPANGPTTTVTVLVVETQQMVASGLSSVLATVERLSVVGCTHTADRAGHLIRETQPDVVILDTRIQGGSERAVRHIAQISPLSTVLVLGLDEPIVDIARVLAAGAGGYVTKHQPFEELVNAVFDVRAGRRVIAPEVLVPLLDHVAHGRPMELSDRQQRLVLLLADGIRTADIAAALGVSVGTLRNQLRGLLVRLGAHSQLEAVAIARRRGLLRNPPSSGERVGS